jgi:hypothetical protein
MKIAILDNESDMPRVIVAEVPAYLSGLDMPADDIAGVIIAALGLHEPEYLIGVFEGDINASLEGLREGFKERALGAATEITG